MVKQKGISRHQVLLVSLLVIIIILSIAAYFLQRNVAIKALAGEAIRQRATFLPSFTPDSGNPKEVQPSQQAPTNQQGGSPVQPGENTLFQECPKELTSENQNWNLPGWKLLSWKSVDAKCPGKRIICYYADDSNDVARADQIAFYQDFEGVNKCSDVKTPGIGCLCEKASS